MLLGKYLESSGLCCARACSLEDHRLLKHQRCGNFADIGLHIHEHCVLEYALRQFDRIVNWGS